MKVILNARSGSDFSTKKVFTQYEEVINETWL